MYDADYMDYFKGNLSKITEWSGLQQPGILYPLVGISMIITLLFVIPLGLLVMV